MNGQYKSFSDTLFLMGVYLLAACATYSGFFIFTGRTIIEPMWSIGLIFFFAVATYRRFDHSSKAIAKERTFKEKMIIYATYIHTGFVIGALLFLFDHSFHL